MNLFEYRPRPVLVVKQTLIEQPRFPVFDAHNHTGSDFGGGWDRRSVTELLDVLDEAGVTHIVDLDGGWGEDILDAHLKHFKAAAPERFLIFGGVNWDAWSEHGHRFGEWAAGHMQAQAAGCARSQNLEAIRSARPGSLCCARCRR